MKVSLQPQITKSNYSQSKSKVYNTSPTKVSKMDSVSFTGKANFAEELLEIISKPSKKMLATLGYSESGRFNRSLESVDVATTRIDLKDKFFFLTEKTKVSTNLLGIEKTQKVYSINKSGEIKAQIITEEKYTNLVQKLKEVAIPAIIEKHGFGNMTVSDILQEIGLKLSRGKIEHKRLSAVQEEVLRLDNDFFTYPDRTVVSLLHAERADHNIIKLGLGSTKGGSMDVISLSDPNEIEKFQQVLKLKSHFTKKENINSTLAKLKDTLAQAQKDFDDYEAGVDKYLAEIDKNIAEDAKKFKQ